MIHETVGTQSPAFPKMRRGAASDSGFGVAEIVVAVAILFVVATGVLGSLAYAAAASKATATRQIGLSIAERQMEQARNLKFDDCGTNPGNPSGKIPVVQYFDASGAPVAKSAAVYTCTTTVTWVSSTNFAKKISITVSWPGPPSGHVTLNSNIVGKSDFGNFGGVTLMVEEAGTGAKLSGASLTIQPSLGNPLTDSTGATGSVTFIRVPTGTMAITSGTLTGYYLDIATLNATSPQVEVNTTKSWTIYAYRLCTGIVIVKDTQNNALNGIEVKLTQFGSTSTSFTVTSGEQGVAGQAIFDANGPNGLRSGTTWIVSGTGEGYQQNASTNLVIPASTTPPRTYYTQSNGTSPGLKMERIPVLTVHVQTSSGDPIEGAKLSSIVPSVNLVPTTGLTNANGDAQYWFLVGKNPAVNFTVSKAGYNTGTGSTGVVVMPVDPYPNPVIVTLTYAPVVVTVTVKNSAGTALPGVQLSPTVTGAVTANPSTQITNSSGQVAFTFTADHAAVNLTSSLTDYVDRSFALPAIAMPMGPYPVPVTMYKKPKLAVTVKDQFTNAITGATLSPINSVSPAAVSNVYTYTFPSAQAPTAFTVAKTGYVTWSGNSLQTILDQTVPQSVVVGKPNLRIPFKFASGDASSYTVYVYTKSTNALYTSFTVTKPSPLGTGVVTTDIPLLAAVYYLSCTGPAAPGTGKLTTPTLTQTLQTYPNGTSAWMTKSN